MPEVSLKLATEPSSKELRRCPSEDCAETAHLDAISNRQTAFKATKITDDIINTIKVLNFGLSPEARSDETGENQRNVICEHDLRCGKTTRSGKAIAPRRQEIQAAAVNNKLW